MVDPSLRVSGQCYTRGSAHSLQAWLWVDQQKKFWLETAKDAPKEIEIQLITPPLSGVESIIEFTTGERFMSDEVLPTEFYGDKAQSYKFVSWLESFTLVKSVIVLIALIFSIFIIYKSLPWIADKAIVFVPKHLDHDIGEQAWGIVDSALFQASELSREEQAEITALFAPIIPSLQNAGFVPRLMFRKSKLFGANALALPGGIIVLTDDLWRAFSDRPEWIQAIFAHEAEHVIARHSMRQILRYAGIGFFAFTIGIDESLIEEGAALIGDFALASYSRDFELSADLGATRILQDIEKDPKAMIGALAGLEAELCAEDGCGESGWLSSHPDIPTRISNIQRHIQQHNH